MSYPMPNVRKLHPKYVDLLQRKIDSVEGDDGYEVKFKVFLSVIHSGFYDCDPNQVGNENDKVYIKLISDRSSCDVYRFASNKVAPKTYVVKLYKDQEDVSAFESFKRDYLRNQYFRKLLKDPATPKDVRDTIYVNEHDAVFNCEKNGELIKVYSTVGVFKGESIYRLCQHFTEDWDSKECQENINSMVNSYNQLRTTVTWLHSKFVYHCNIDPSNILFDLDSKRFWLIDFDHAYCGDFYEEALSKNQALPTPFDEATLRCFVDVKVPVVKAVYQTTEVFFQAQELRKKVAVYKKGRFVLKKGELISNLTMSNCDRYPFQYVMMNFFCKVCSHFKTWSKFGTHVMSIIVNLPDFDTKCIESAFINLNSSRRHWFFNLKEMLNDRETWEQLVEPEAKGYKEQDLVDFKQFLEKKLVDYDPQEGDSEGTQDFIFDCSTHFDMDLPEGYFDNGRKRKAPSP